MDISSLIGITLGLLAIITGRILESGSLTSLIALTQINAFVIVIGGTLGAMIFGARKQDILNIPKLFRIAFTEVPLKPELIIPQIVKYAEKARREGLLSLEKEVATVDDLFLKQGLQLVADGTDPDIVKSIMEIELSQQEERHVQGSNMLDQAGAFAPTIGIIGAVLGLIYVMEHLSEGIERIGGGIATAFVATIYGLVFANICLHPMANKLRAKSKEEKLVREMILEGILSIQAGDNPRIIEEKLKAFISASHRLQYEAVKEALKRGG